jgi:hypothetical protein
MGRPLKIQKSSTGSGNGGAAVGVDLGYPNFNSLTNPVFNSPVQTLNGTQYLGVVGGAGPTDAPTATNPRVDVTVNITGSAGVAQGYIIRQKGSHKYLVGDVTSINDEDLVVGLAYMILSVGDTDWVSCGAPTNYGVGTIFTCTNSIGAGSGTANLVGVCVLQDSATPTAGFMSISYIDDTSSEVFISKLTNKFLLGWEGGSDYAATSVVADTRQVANFFTDEGTVIKSGTAQTTINVALVQNVTS